ncbi:hypothetical protein AVEN_61497-1, partial [Araneus ventricosus]
GSFVETPSKLHCQSLRFPRTTAVAPNPAFAREPHSSSNKGLHFVVFAFVKEPHNPYPPPHFGFVTQHSKWIANEVQNPNFSTKPRQFLTDFALTTRFGATRLNSRGAVSP